MDVGEEVYFVINKTKSFPCVQTHHNKLLSVLNFVATGFDYSKYLKAFDCKMAKGFVSL